MLTIKVLTALLWSTMLLHKARSKISLIFGLDKYHSSYEGLKVWIRKCGHRNCREQKRSDRRKIR